VTLRRLQFANILACSPSLFIHASAPPAISTLSLHDALPIFRQHALLEAAEPRVEAIEWNLARVERKLVRQHLEVDRTSFRSTRRSEEHTSELQSHLNLVCRLLLEKKKKIQRQALRIQNCHHT